MHTVFLQAQKQSGKERNEKPLLDIFVKAKDAPQMVAGLQYFVKKVVSKADIGSTKAEREIVRWSCRTADDALALIVASGSVT